MPDFLWRDGAICGSLSQATRPLISARRMFIRFPIAGWYCRATCLRHRCTERSGSRGLRSAQDGQRVFSFLVLAAMFTLFDRLYPLNKTPDNPSLQVDPLQP